MQINLICLSGIIIIIIMVIKIIANGVTNNVPVLEEDLKKLSPAIRPKRSYLDGVSERIFEVEKQEVIEKIKQLIVDDVTRFDLTNEELDDFIAKNKAAPVIDLPKLFNNWQNSSRLAIKLFRIGVQLLQNYEKTKNPIYDEFAQLIVEITYKKFDTISKLFRTNSTKRTTSVGIDVSINLMRFLVAYEYIGNNKTVKLLMCHDLIYEMIPTIHFDNQNGFQEFYSLQYAMTRLLTNYLYDYNKSFYKDIQLITQEKSISSLNIIISKTNNIARGVYEDGSCISLSHVPNYGYLQTYFNSSYFKLYEEICKVIVSDVGNFPRIVKEISEKLCHPYSPHVPFGMFDAEGYTVRTNWWDIDGLDRSFIVPFIGLGIFKTKELIFSVRVQRPHMASCQLDGNKTGDFIIGSIQLRKAYLTNYKYPSKLTRKELINEPGIISIANSDIAPISFLNENNLKNNSYTCDDIDPDNFIALLPDSGGILIWFNKYKCNLIHSTIIEVSIFTNNGLESHYIIHNHGPNVIQFRTQDQLAADNLINLKYKREFICISEPASVDGFVKFPPAVRTHFVWRMVFDPTKRTNITYQMEERRISFNFASHAYKVYMKDESQYIIQRNDRKVLAGSSSSLVNDSMKIDGHVYVRNPFTLMYS